MVDILIQKKCSKCLNIKPVYEFSKNKLLKSGLHTYCKSCQNIMYLKLKEKKLNGHNFVSEKKCKTCGEVKPRDCFTISISSDGLFPYCKVCNNEINKVKYNSEEGKIQSRNNQNRYYKKRYGLDDLFRLKRNVSVAVCGYLKKTGDKKNWVSIEKILKYEISDLIDSIGCRPSINHQLDHKIPCSWFSTDCPIELIWSIENLWWVTKEYNQTKSNRWCDEVPIHYLEKVKPFLKYNNDKSL